MSPGVDLVFLWHHHQPDYRHPRDGRSVLPWVRLHATKDSSTWRSTSSAIRA